MKHLLYLLFHGKFHELMVEPTNDGFIQFFRFIFVGGSATLVDIGTGWLFFTFVFKKELDLGLFTLSRDVISAAVGFILGLVVNYILSILWVFRRKDINRVGEFAAFAVIGLVGLFIKSGIIALMGLFIYEQTGLLFLIKSFCGTMVAFIWNFTARKLLIYNR